MAQGDVDVVVVGAGTGGLTAAAYLAAAGRRVAVLDRGWSPGGHATVFARDGYEFDVGLHYLGSDRAGAPATRALLSPLGIDVDYRAIEPADTVVLPDGGRFAVPRGVEAWRAALHEALPAERAAIDRYVDALDAIDSELHRLAGASGLAGLPQTLLGLGALMRHSRRTVGGFWDDLRLSPRARTLLGWLHGVYAVAPSEASLLVHGLVSLHYVRGAWYPSGGGGVLSDRLADVVRAHGGELRQRHEVTRIVVQGGRVTAVEATDPAGERVTVRAPVVVAAGDVKRTFLDLLDPAVVPVRRRRRVRGYEMALPLAVLYLVVDRDLAAEGVPVTNFAVVTRDDPQHEYDEIRRGDLPAEPSVWVTIASLKDPGNERLCRPGQSNLQLVAVAPPHPRAWGLRFGDAPGPAYGAAKDEVRDRMLRVADRALPGLSESVAYADLATPYTDERFVGVTDGTSYGIAAIPDQMLLGRPGPRTHIGGLFLAGASTRTGHGITATMAGGVAAASAVLGRPAAPAVQGRRQPS